VLLSSYYIIIDCLLQTPFFAAIYKKEPVFTVDNSLKMLYNYLDINFI